MNSDDSPQKNTTVIWFGVSLAVVDELVYQKQVGCLGLVATREPVSLNMIKKWSSQSKFKDQKALKIMLSGDISYSYVPHEAEIIRHKKKYQKKLMSLFLR